MTKKPLFIAIIVTLFIAVGLFVFLSAFWTADQWPPPESPPRQGEALDVVLLAQGKIAHSYQALKQVVREPQNTWTNLAYVFVGALLFSIVPAGFPRQAAIALIGLGIGSFLYHASASRILRNTDVAAMYWVYAVVIILALGVIFPAIKPSVNRARYVLAVVIPLISIVVTIFRNVRVIGFKPFELTLFTGFVAVIAVTALLVIVWKQRKISELIFLTLVCGLFAMAVVCQTGDRPGGWFCDPSRLIQGHSLWHIFSALACGLLAWKLSLEWMLSRQVAPPRVAALDSY